MPLVARNSATQMCCKSPFTILSIWNNWRRWCWGRQFSDTGEAKARRRLWISGSSTEQVPDLLHPLTQGCVVPSFVQE
eukprot:8033836-Alexandrium_andersonii.AAC.1